MKETIRAVPFKMRKRILAKHYVFPCPTLRSTLSSFCFPHPAHHELSHLAMPNTRQCDNSWVSSKRLLRRRFGALRELDCHFGQIDFIDSFRSVRCRTHSDGRARRVALAYDFCRG